MINNKTLFWNNKPKYGESYLCLEVSKNYNISIAQISSNSLSTKHKVNLTLFPGNFKLDNKVFDSLEEAKKEVEILMKEFSEILYNGFIKEVNNEN